MEQLCTWSHLNGEQNNSIFWFIEKECDRNDVGGGGFAEVTYVSVSLEQSLDMVTVRAVEATDHSTTKDK